MRPKSENKKINIGTIGHVDHGKKTLAASIALALCSADPTEDVATGLCFELPTDGTLPTELQLTPAGVRIEGTDGRNWINDQPDKVAASLNAIISAGRDLVVDFNHATELKAPKGEDAPAAAFIKGPIEHRGNGILVGLNVEWTPGGKASVAAKEYRYISPALRFERSTGRVVGLSSVGLTNVPNLNLTALNSQQQQHEKGENIMLEQLLKALGLDPNLTDASVALNAIAKLQGDLSTALNRAETPDPEKFVPKDDHDLALNRATTAETALAKFKQEGIDTEINSAVDAAISEGKVAPASRDYHIACCQAEGGLDRFTEQMKVAPAIIPEDQRKGDPPESKSTAINAEQAKVADMFGNSAEDLAETRKTA